MIQTLEIAEWVPAPVLNAGHHHWSVANRRAQLDKTVALLSARQAGWKRVSGRARLDITLVFPVKRNRDTDNGFARCKHVVDGLKPFLVDDSSEWLELHVEQVVERGTTATRLRLEAL